MQKLDQDLRDTIEFVLMTITFFAAVIVAMPWIGSLWVGLGN
jgi:hypothetical protein